ncbi:hypothetical protein [Couchioplanes caeruleus]|uniref:Uncharacterized protein n=2 Tax=Couchioplanes caeruleus TaxID=56438 RepID=A0A1K0FPG2_9ACTN|nr:hypothetical protein [Couchioplanes caeruleus]OJF14681.1 hypothetical protein BG844_08565 [Couchioplanes caeruleus subsp. caeruleus]ROP30080.1 hypothetical protein EDD30_2911 [Couchioplanes caeruleus]
MAAEELRTAVQRLLAQVGHWETGRWAVSAGAGTRGDLVHTLVQRLADLGAEAERRPHREVPREADTTLPDQLRVMTGDLLAVPAADELLAQAAAAIRTAREAL